MKIIEFKKKVTKIMKILEFHLTYENLRIIKENQENNGNHNF